VDQGIEEIRYKEAVVAKVNYDRVNVEKEMEDIKVHYSSELD